MGKVDHGCARADAGDNENEQPASTISSLGREALPSGYGRLVPEDGQNGREHHPWAGMDPSLRRSALAGVARHVAGAARTLSRGRHLEKLVDVIAERPEQRAMQGPAHFRLADRDAQATVGLDLVELDEALHCRAPVMAVELSHRIDQCRAHCVSRSLSRRQNVQLTGAAQLTEIESDR
jgi:hypothetical protein